MSGQPILPPDPVTLPLLPLRDVVVFPHMVIPLFVGRPKSIKALESAMESGRQIMLVSYWDGGYVNLDVTDPRNVVKLEDSDFGVDPIFPQFNPSEGNAHQAEFSFDNRYVVAADEDFNPFRGRIQVQGGGGGKEVPLEKFHAIGNAVDDGVLAGDLALRVGDTPRALGYFERVDLSTEQGETDDVASPAEVGLEGVEDLLLPAAPAGEAPKAADATAGFSVA